MARCIKNTLSSYHGALSPDHSVPGCKATHQVKCPCPRDLLREVLLPTVCDYGPLQAMPTAFMARSDEASDVAAVWGEVWEDSGNSAAASLRLYMADILPLLIQGTVLCPFNTLTSPNRRHLAHTNERRPTIRAAAGLFK